MLTKFKHRFLTCTGFHHQGSETADDLTTFLTEPLVIEPRFREQFEVADLDAEYEHLLEVSANTCMQLYFLFHIILSH